jgi:hypothetical protein
MIGITIRKTAILFLLLLSVQAAAQEGVKKSMLLTGVVMDAEEGIQLPYVNVKIKDSFYGTATDANGYFSMFIAAGDTIEFSYVGYEDASFIMPFDLEATHYSLLQLLQKDTLMLEEVVVFQWPDYQDFIDAFLDADPPEITDELVVEVKQNINQAVEESERSKYYYDQQRYQRLFLMHNIFPPNHFLDPSRWAEFIRSLRDEDLRNDEE